MGGTAAGASAVLGGRAARLQQQVAAMFTRALEFAPENAELHAVLGVLHNLSREYPKVSIGLTQPPIHPN